MDKNPRVLFFFLNLENVLKVHSLTKPCSDFLVNLANAAQDVDFSSAKYGEIIEYIEKILLEDIFLSNKNRHLMLCMFQREGHLLYYLE